MSEPTTIAKIYDVLANGELSTSGTIALPDGAATETTLASVLAALASVAVTGPLTDTQLRAAALPVSALSLPLPEGAATETTLASVLSALTAPIQTAEQRVVWTNATGTIATSGDNTLVVAPGAGQRLVLAQLHIQLEGVVSTTILIKHGATVVSRLVCDFKGDGLRDNYAAGRDVILPENTALVLNLSGSNSVGWGVRYRTEASA
jgi:hypothetical protein